MAIVGLKILKIAISLCFNLKYDIIEYMKIISEENKIKLIKRLKSFLWRSVMVGGAMFANFVAANLELFDLPYELVVIFGLVLGEVTKWLNSKKN